MQIGHKVSSVDAQGFYKKGTSKYEYPLCNIIHRKCVTAPPVRSDRTWKPTIKIRFETTQMTNEAQILTPKKKKPNTGFIRCDDNFGSVAIQTKLVAPESSSL